MALSFYSGDKIPFSIYVQDRAGAPVNVTGWTAEFRFKAGDGVVYTKTGLSPTDPTNPKGGKFSYTNSAGEMPAGTMYWEWTVKPPGGESTGPSPRRSREVVARLV
jgi:hypothetical protein